MSDEAATPAIGDNFKNLPLTEQLEIETSDLAERQQELLGSFGRAPEAVTSDETLGKFGTLVKQIDEVLKRAESAREDRKAPFLAGGRTVDQHYGSLKDPLEAAKKKLLARATIYSNNKAAEARRKLQEEADRKRAEEEAARKKAEDAKRATTAEKHTAIADTAAAEAKAVEKEIETARPADLARTRGDVTLATLRTVWVGIIEDAEQLDLEALRPYMSGDVLQKLVNAYTKVHKGSKPLRGARFEEQSSQQFR